MRLIPYNILIENSECIAKTSYNSAYFTKCKNRKRLGIDKQDNIQDTSSKRYLEDTSSIRSSGIYFSSIAKTNHFERIYDIPEWQLVYKQGKEELANSREFFYILSTDLKYLYLLFYG